MTLLRPFRPSQTDSPSLEFPFPSDDSGPVGWDDDEASEDDVVSSIPTISDLFSSQTLDSPTDSGRSSIDYDDDDDSSSYYQLESGNAAGCSRREAGHGPRKSFPRISKPVELLRSSYDCVVIGSGYGGGVAASRMARAGESVCLLERGEERWPGEYPVTTREAVQQFHVSGDLRTAYSDGSSLDGGNPMGMYHLVFGKDQSAMVGNGLGGTSLINANVFLEADESLLSMDFWPPEIRNDPGGMKKYYQAARDVLEPEPYPDHWPKLKKMELFERQAKILGMGDRFHRVPQTTRFRPGPNSCGVNMSASTLTGQDAMGLNDGSKTTTLVTYLADAWNWGADMFCQCEVRYIEKVQDERGGYIIHFAWHGHNRGRFGDNLREDLLWVHAKKAVFLGAGAIGTTEILLRSKAMGLPMSECVGRGMSGNGDMLAFACDVDSEVNGVGSPTPSPTNPVGPTITSMIDHRKGHENPLNGFVIQEGAIPQALSEVLQVMMELLPGQRREVGADSNNNPNKSILGRARDVVGGFKSRLLGPFSSSGAAAMDKTQVFLVMSHDGSQASLSLRDDKPVLEFIGVGKSERVKELNDLLAKATTAVGGRLVQSPFYATMGQQQITAHPLGGANMSWDNTGAHGVTNHLGQVFIGNHGSETHAGLIVTDGALIPNAIGVNPLATIAALAERAVSAFVDQNGLVVSQESNGMLDLYGEPAHRPRSSSSSSHNFHGRKEKEDEEAEEERLETVANLIHEAEILRANRLDFVELLSGFVHGGGCEDDFDDRPTSYETAFRVGKSRGQSARLFVNVAVLDPDMLLTDQGSSGILTGTFVCPAIRGSPFMVLQGDFGLFRPDDVAAGTSRLTYDFDMVGVNGRRLHFHGYKTVDGSIALDPRQLWRSTTTIYICITETDGSSEHGGRGGRGGRRREKVVACGILHVRPGDLKSELLTLTPTGQHVWERVFKLAGFASRFAVKSASYVLAPLAPLQYPVQTYQAFINYTAPTASHVIVACDGVRTELHMWEPGAEAEVETKDLFMIPGASVDHHIFALPTIPFNAVNYFTRAGYRVWVAVHRIGKLESTRGQPWTTYDARLDLRACLEHIRGSMHHDDEDDDNSDNDNDKGRAIYTIAHCMGSVAFSCGLLDGTIPASWIRGITASQVFMNPVWSRLNMAKATSSVGLDEIYARLVGDWLEVGTSDHDARVQQVLNQTLRFYPEERREMCANACCRRTTLLFGRCWSHENLNEATHRNMDRFFGGASMTLMQLLKRMGSRGRVSTNFPEHAELTTAANVERLRGIPMLLFSGADSAVLSPEATQRTYDILRTTFSPSAGLKKGGIEYRRRLVPGYGHLDCWMGKRAWKDVYPFVREEVDRVVRGETYRFRSPNDRFFEEFGV